MSRARLWLVPLVSVLACSGADDRIDDGLHYDTEDQPAPTLENEDGPQSPELRLMSVDELAASVSVAAGEDLSGQPMTWQVDVDGDGFTEDAYSDEAFGRTLGRPDYVTVTEESGAPTTLYAKFTRDMARAMCDRIIGADVLRTSEQTLWRFASHTAEPDEGAITANLRYLMLRFWGQPAAAGDPVLESLRRVYAASRDSYQGGGSTPQIEGWRGVCIALFEDAAFHLH